jgi:hypothetical protein
MHAYTADAAPHTRMLAGLTTRIGLTPRGLAALHVSHTEELIAALGPDDRRYIIEMLRDLVAELTA